MSSPSFTIKPEEHSAQNLEQLLCGLELSFNKSPGLPCVVFLSHLRKQQSPLLAQPML